MSWRNNFPNSQVSTYTKICFDALEYLETQGHQIEIDRSGYFRSCFEGIKAEGFIGRSYFVMSIRDVNGDYINVYKEGGVVYWKDNWKPVIANANPATIAQIQRSKVTKDNLPPPTRFDSPQIEVGSAWVINKAAFNQVMVNTVVGLESDASVTTEAAQRPGEDPWYLCDGLGDKHFVFITDGEIVYPLTNSGKRPRVTNDLTLNPRLTPLDHFLVQKAIKLFNDRLG